MGRRFKKVSRDDQERDYEKALNRGVDFIDSEIPQFKPRDGSNCVRWIRPLEGDKMANHPLGAEILVHFIQGFGYYVSPKTLDKEAQDPLDELSREVLKSQDPGEDKMISTSRRIVGHILDLVADPERGELKIYVAPATLVEDMLYAAKDRRTGKTYSLEDPEDGIPVFFDRTGAQRNTKYKGVELDRDSFPIEDDLAEDMEYIGDVLLIKSTEELQEIADKVMDSLRGSGRSRRSARGDGDKDEDDGRGSRRGRSRARGGDEDSHREQEESPPPRSRRGGRGRDKDDGDGDRDRDSRDDKGGDQDMDETRERIAARLKEEQGKGGDDGDGRRGFRGRGGRDEPKNDGDEGRSGGRRRRRN